MDEWLTGPEVGDWIRTPVETLRYWRSHGLGPRSVKFGRRVLYARADVEKWIAEVREASAS
jgi:Helix-turn-helix domain